MENLGDMPGLRFAPSVSCVDVSSPVLSNCALGWVFRRSSVMHSVRSNMHHCILTFFLVLDDCLSSSEDRITPITAKTTALNCKILTFYEWVVLCFN